MKRKFIPILTISALLSLGALSGTLVSCGDNPVNPTPSIKEVSISATKETIKIGEETQITVKADGATVTSGFSIESSDPTVAVVLGTKVKGLKVGTAKLTATFKGVKSQELTITVTEDASSYVSLTAAIQEASDGECKESKGVTTNEFAVKGVIVSTDKDQNMVIYDGETYGYIYKKANTDISSYNVGDVVSVKGPLTNYYGVLQFSDPKVEKINDKIELPKAKEYGAEDFVKFGTNANKNNSKITTGIATRNEYVTAKKLKYVGGHKFEIEGVSKEDFKLINCYKAEAKLREQIGKIVNGSEVTVTGSILGFNSGNGYFNLVPTSFEVTKVAIKAEGITLDVGTGTVKTYEALELNATLTPEGAGGNVTYQLASGDETKAKIVGNKLYGLAVGEVTVTAKVDDKVSEAKKVTITAGDNEFATAQTKTVSEMAALTTADQKVAYKVTGVVTEAKDTDIFGNITIKAEDGTDTIGSYGVSSDFTAFSKQADGTLKFTNPKNFNTAILNKLFAKGDTVEFFVVPYVFTGKTEVQFYFAFNRLVKKAEGTVTPTPSTETTMDGLYKVANPEIGKTYKFGLDQKNSEVNKTLYLKGDIQKTNFFGSTENPAESVDVTLEGTLEACKAYFTKDNIKTYIETATYTNSKGNTSYKATLVTTPTLTWKYDSTLKTLVTTIDGVDVYIGTYNNFTTFSVSKTSYATSDTNYVSHFLAKLEDSEKVKVTGVTADASITVEEQATKKITASVTPDNATVKGLTYTSNNTEIATVSDDGAVTGVKAGETTITVTSKDDPTKTATVNVSVTKKQVVEGVVEKTYTLTNITGTASADETVVTFFNDEVITFEHSAGTNKRDNPKVTTFDTSLRMYKGHNLIVTAKDNIDLQSISFTYSSEASDKVVELVAKSGETTFASKFDKTGLSFVVEGLSGYKTITFSNNGQARLASMKVSYIIK